LQFCFQAEDGIRDRNVTGVQTCALPISVSPKTCGDAELLAEALWRERAAYDRGEQLRVPAQELVDVGHRVVARAQHSPVVEDDGGLRRCPAPVPLAHSSVPS